MPLAKVPISTCARWGVLGRSPSVDADVSWSPLSLPLPSTLFIGPAKLAVYSFPNLEAESPAVNTGLSDTGVESFANGPPPPLRSRQAIPKQDV